MIIKTHSRGIEPKVCLTFRICRGKPDCNEMSCKPENDPNCCSTKVCNYSNSPKLQIGTMDTLSGAHLHACQGYPLPKLESLDVIKRDYQGCWKGSYIELHLNNSTKIRCNGGGNDICFVKFATYQSCQESK